MRGHTGWRTPVSLALALCLATPTVAHPVAPQADSAATVGRLRAEVEFLASDAMAGRQTGTPQYDTAVAHVADAMAAAGLKPAGDRGGWTQKFAVIAAQTLTGQTMRVTRGGRATALRFGTDWTQSAEVGPTAVNLTAPVVFAGYGIVDPVSGRDDFAGLNLTGRIVAVLARAPAGLDADRSYYLAARDYKARMARARGAIGIVTIESAAATGNAAFSSAAKNWNGGSIGWRTPDGTVGPIAGAPYLGYLSRRGAAKLFAGSPIGWKAVQVADRAGAPLPKGPLGVELAVALHSRTMAIPSANVVGRLEGSDPTLKAEHVVLTAHLDHIADGGAVKGDAIYNGALDNAIGVASMLEVARRMAAGLRPKRSILFVAVGAEEVGLIGSDYFAHYPTVPASSVVANVNLDMPILTYRFVDLVATGAERSSIGPLVAAVAKRHGVALVPDPLPEEHNFVRSDHYSFVKQGVPAVSLELGPGGPGLAATRAFLKDHYHQPSDQLSLPIDWESAVRFVDINIDIVRELATVAERPTFNRSDLFGMTYGRAGRAE